MTRRRVQPYAGAQPLQQAEVSERLAAIDRTQPAGMRDHALLLVGLITFRRVEELAGLRWQDVEQRRSGVVMLIFRHCKGGKVIRDTLPVSVSRRLMEYLHQVYGLHIARHTALGVLFA